MWLLAGLGNPGPAYRDNRHNIGAMALDSFVGRHWPMGTWRRRFQGESTEFTVDSNKVLALKPHTFMNESGASVGEAARFYKIELPNIIVLHDDLDLDFGRVEVKQGGGHGGHNGLKSIDAALGRDYWRLRLGIGHPLPNAAAAGIPKEVKDRIVVNHVLGNFAKPEMKALDGQLAAIADALPVFFSSGAEAFKAAYKMALV